MNRGRSFWTSLEARIVYVAALVGIIAGIFDIIGINLKGLIPFKPIAPKIEKYPFPPSLETIVYKTATGKKYHNDGCQHLKYSKIRITLGEACAAGLEPCKICKPPPCPKSMNAMLN